MKLQNKTLEIKRLSFEEWKKLFTSEELEEFEEAYICDCCNGSGVCECDCGDIHDCKACNGDGHNTESALYKRYLNQVNKEDKLLNLLNLEAT